MDGSNSSNNRQLALERELEQLAKVNLTVSNLIKTIRTTSGNIQRTNQATQNTKILLNQWIRILSQASFTNEIINNDSWNGRSINIAEEEIEQKLRLEKQLEDEARALDEENVNLLNKIQAKENEKSRFDTRTREQSNKRLNELGLAGVRQRKRPTPKDRLRRP